MFSGTLAGKLETNWWKQNLKMSQVELGDMVVNIVIHDVVQQQYEYFWNTGYHVVN